MFKGWNVAYPEYEVITPQTHESYHMKSLNVREEEKLKGSLLTPTKITDHLNRCIFESIVKKPDKIKDYDAYLKNVTLKDRDALLYGLFHITYEEIRNYDIKCSACAKDYPVTIKISKAFSNNPYPEKDILKKEVKIPLEVTKGVSAFIKQPTLFDEITSLKTSLNAMGSNIDLLTETLVIVKFVQDTEDGATAEYKDRGDVIDAYLDLPAKDKRIINKAYVDNFGKYGIELKMKSYCQFCGQEEEVDLDLVGNFFTNLYTA